ncbi:DUF4878 domain-containing protein [Prevotella sp. 10(H)]|uniref:DUF4878 domain-containing protein n=1 Tax=Prevotella sp. 10(H) TaxID=1158294 RepID=UPI0004A6FAD7|nr:DUF4878 domain-containing protein [Prevotella sp. 10(H)]
MKKLLFTLFAVALMCSCSSGPQKAAQSFSENLSKGKVEEAKKYATEATGKLLDFASSMGTSKVDPDFKFEFVKDSVVDNRAWVTFKDKNTDREQTLHLVKIDGDWKVNIESKK